MTEHQGEDAPPPDDTSVAGGGGPFGAGAAPDLPGTDQSDPARLSPGLFGVAPILSEPARSTPLEDDEPQGEVPAAALWAMKDRQHSRRGGEQLRVRLGDKDEEDALYVIDDGPAHCMIGRLVGASPDGVTYCLVAHVPIDTYHQMAEGELPRDDAFGAARDISLCGVVEQQRSSNVFLVQHYRRADQVPAEYLPPSPFLEFADEASTDGGT